MTLRDDLQAEREDNQRLRFALGVAKRRVTEVEAENAHLYTVARQLSDYVRKLQRLNELILPTVLPEE